MRRSEGEIKLTSNLRRPMLQQTTKHALNGQVQRMSRLHHSLRNDATADALVHRNQTDFRPPELLEEPVHPRSIRDASPILSLHPLSIQNQHTPDECGDLSLTLQRDEHAAENRQPLRPGKHVFLLRERVDRVGGEELCERDGVVGEETRRLLRLAEERSDQRVDTGLKGTPEREGEVFEEGLKRLLVERSKHRYA